MTEYPNCFEISAQENFETHLKEYAGKPDLKFLQIGAFTGDASLWMLNNILTDESSTLTDVDTWLGSDEEVHKTMDFDDVHKVYLEKTNRPNCHWFKGTSIEYLLDLEREQFDFIYIDGDHTASGVIDDAIMGWAALKPGGIMAFDDYTWAHEDGVLYMPHEAINFFMWVKQGQYETITVNSQVWIKKNA